MTIAETIQLHVQALPQTLQREILDFVAWLEQRYHIHAPATIHSQLDTEAFLGAITDTLGDDFPDDISDADLKIDIYEKSLD